MLRIKGEKHAMEGSHLAMHPRSARGSYGRELAPRSGEGVRASDDGIR